MKFPNHNRSSEKQLNIMASCYKDSTSRRETLSNLRDIGCLARVIRKFPDILVSIHTYSLYALMEVRTVIKLFDINRLLKYLQIYFVS